ncbi:hypothetical protein C5167_031802 [Papaver somniferum]|uniref:Pentacotripeptide-repeat region of PRORP domain-containing protein n=1 Tax=Papaver somniferum TaxID=3469 RepID=A0A4Y7K6V4_PAPSO|nr:pentatricopeptide repeat-containing protein At1g80270, mitochondrial-like [Papaver somniferum]XP_026400665.1 pentatricopeptide repeat-containing protein At1g80270, mitochondrial-like [Papaver somniferum]XP_026400666.1 pentatricopeptide repeat-containing protein At1g80270, mitochondrial-like [Papaver somniferum]XP_026400667.1 pentatricopeptide repeat-containing protein At1g80270, mitochondrial-like [Papaver somniferum]RZC68556.1 hypothetical protein C5167_031802 [Papaver somniferum]
MFTPRRASNLFRTRLHCLRAVEAAAPPQTYQSKSNILHQISQNQPINLHQTQPHHRNFFTFLGSNSQSDAKSNGEEQQRQQEDEGENLEDGIDELGDSSTKEEDAVPKAEEKEEVRTVSFSLFNVVASAPSRDVYAALDKSMEEIKEVEHVKIREVLHNLRKCKMYEFAYQLSNWLESKHLFNCEEEKDYATRLDLIAKRRGMALAEKYMNNSIPETCKGETVYGTMLWNYVSVGDVKNAEQVFEKMRELGFPVSGFVCQQMILLYKKFDKRKIKSVLLLMEENDVKPTRFTYLLLIDLKGEANDIAGMEELVEALKSDGLELDNYIRAVLARHYIGAGFGEKAGEILKEMEGEGLEENHGACKNLLPLYAALGKADEVERIWKVCEADGHADDCLAAISAFGKVGRVEKAEEIFEKRIKSGRNISSKVYTALMDVYVDHKLLAKGEDLVKRMASSGCPINRFLWDSLVKLYIDAGEVEKADAVLQKALQQWDKRKKPPLYKSFHVIMDQYSRRGDIHNTEKIFHHLKQSGYVSKIWDYQSLLQAYIKAKVPAYGLRERMMADNLTPNKFVAGQLAQVDPFKKTAISDLLD